MTSLFLKNGSHNAFFLLVGWPPPVPICQVDLQGGGKFTVKESLGKNEEKGGGGRGNKHELQKKNSLRRMKKGSFRPLGLPRPCTGLEEWGGKYKQWT